MKVSRSIFDFLIYLNYFLIWNVEDFGVNRSYSFFCKFRLSKSDFIIINAKLNPIREKHNKVLGEVDWRYTASAIKS